MLTPWRHDVAAVLEAWYPGQEGGTALAHVLFGDVDPGGRLPVTFPADASQLPTAGDPARYPGVAEQVDYSEGVLVGYKWYDAHHFAPAYPFGAGLSYTRFRYGALHVSPAHGTNHVATATMTVTNTGDRAGIAVPQLYLGKPSARSLPQPVRQLVGYRSVRVPAGRTVRVSFPLDDRSFASWGSHGWRIVPGCYRLSAGPSSRSAPGRGPTVGRRRRSCRGSAADLGTRGHFFRPLPPEAPSVLLPPPG